MFGYITIHKDELKIKDFTRYQAYYCGVCRSLANRYGLTGRITLSYDMTFLALLLSGLYEDGVTPCSSRCILHPFKKHQEITCKYTDYAAAVNVMLAYYKLKDNWEDDRSIKSNAASGLLKHAFKKAQRDYPVQSEVIKNYIDDERKMEQSGVTDIDTVSACTGRMLGDIFSYANDEWHDNLYQMGFFLGRFIYIMDAYDDIDKDIKKHNFNPLTALRDRADFDEYCKGILTMYAAEAAKAFERLPVVDNIDILRNIIYAGIWSRFNRIMKDKNERGMI